VTPADVIDLTAKGYGVSVEAITGRARTRYVCKARREAIRSLRAIGLSFDEIGALLGNRDHSTLISALRFVEKPLNPRERNQGPTTPLREPQSPGP
jgi:chromosomal replication initiation ATPase DnaA